MKDHRVKLSLVFWLASGLACLNCAAAELRPQITERHLGIALTDLKLPTSLATDIQSGLENRILFRIEVLAGTRQVVRTDVGLVVKYDLWDEIFYVRMLPVSGERKEVIFKRGDEVLRHIANLQLPALFALESLPRSGPWTLKMEVFIDPVEEEKIDRVSKWVAANSAPNTVGLETPLAGKSNELFNRLFEQYLRGHELAAPWKTIVTSAPFDPQKP
jgi:hypothetical protein